MSILVNAATRVITQGMTGETGTFHTEQALAYGTNFTKLAPVIFTDLLS